MSRVSRGPLGSEYGSRMRIELYTRVSVGPVNRQVNSPKSILGQPVTHFVQDNCGFEAQPPGRNGLFHGTMVGAARKRTRTV